jgi:hypothetical protein
VGVEYVGMLGQMAVTESAIQEAEQQLGIMLTSRDFLKPAVVRGRYR